MPLSLSSAFAMQASVGIWHLCLNLSLKSNGSGKTSSLWANPTVMGMNIHHFFWLQRMRWKILRMQNWYENFRTMTMNKIAYHEQDKGKDQTMISSRLEVPSCFAIFRCAADQDAFNFRDEWLIVRDAYPQIRSSFWPWRVMLTWNWSYATSLVAVISSILVQDVDGKQFNTVVVSDKNVSLQAWSPCVTAGFSLTVSRQCSGNALQAEKNFSTCVACGWPPSHQNP